MIKGILILWALILAYEDISIRRIPNILSLGGCAVGLGWLMFTGRAVLGQEPLLIFLGFALALLLTLPAYVIRKLGAGDVKLLSAISLMGGVWIVAEVFFFAAMLAGIVATAYLYLDRYKDKLSERKPIPFGAAMSIGLIVTLMLPDNLGLRAWLT